MMRRLCIFLGLMIAWAGSGVGAPPRDTHLIQDPGRRIEVQSRFETQKKRAEKRAPQLFAVFDQPLTLEEREALTFLFAYMPLEDLADYDGDFFLRAVRATLEARRTMPWGRSIPEDVFLAYVLPYRVNTENLDEARTVLFQELRDRIRRLPLERAILEVNHWCHEKVTYRPTDARTSGPLSTLRTSWGRCGEESVFTVSALRAVGIPARQVYTPRWAHVDDNHAWVEAWVDGVWRFLGACEPEPKLDMGWFKEPARRAMMVHTKVFGGSRTADPKVRSTPFFDEIQVLATYAPVVERSVLVVDSQGHPVSDATVEFGLYNSAEFYPLVTKPTDAAGRASLVSGSGDLRLWVWKDGRAGAGLLTGGQAEITIQLLPFDAAERVEELDLNPPVEPFPQACPARSADIRRNAARVAEEDRARQAYMATFATEERSALLARELECDPATLWPLMQKSQGNHQEIVKFLRDTPLAWRRWALEILAGVSEKDLRDTPAPVFRDHLDHVLATAGDLPQRDPALFLEALLAPRIHNELLTPWRGALQAALGGEFLASVRTDPGKAVTWVREQIRIDREANWYGVPMRPLGVLQLRTADPLGRDILFVALCRTAGLPARLEPASGTPQYFDQGWKNVYWDGQPPQVAPKGTLRLTGQFDSPPTYFVHFALARWENGRFETLDFEGKPWSFFQSGVTLEAGHYCLTTGLRQGDGSVLARLHYFDLNAGQKREVPLVIRVPKSRPQVLGRVDLSTPLKSLREGKILDLSAIAAPKGAIVAWIAPGQEPTHHALGDLERLRDVLQKWEGGLVLVLSTPLKNEGAVRELLDRLPSQTQLALDAKGVVLDQARKAIQRSGSTSLPAIFGITPQGDLLFFSEGYRIGVGEQVLRTIRTLGN